METAATDNNCHISPFEFSADIPLVRILVQEDLYLSSMELVTVSLSLLTLFCGAFI
jgi:hypothetical protein